MILTIPRIQKILLSAGLIPLPWFIFWVTVGGLLLPGYSALTQHGSELLAVGGVAALCLKIAAVGSGLAFICFGVGLWLVSAQPIVLGALAWVFFGVSMVSNGIWPIGSPMHGLYALGIINLVAPALSHVEMSRWFQLNRYYALTAFVSFCGIVYLWLNLTGMDPASYRGLTQRIFSSINSLWPFLISLALVKEFRKKR